MSDKAKYAWTQVIVVVLILHWVWGYFALVMPVLGPMVVAVCTAVIAYPPLMWILMLVGVVVPTFVCFIPMVLAAAGVYKVMGIWHMW